MMSMYPPNYSPQPRTAAPQDPRGRVAQTAGRTIAVFGAPGSGVSTILRCLRDASNARLAVLAPGYEPLDEMVRIASQNDGAEAVFLDGFPTVGRRPDNSPFGAESAQFLYDRRLVYTGMGAIVRVDVDPDLLVAHGRATRGGVEAYLAGLPELDRRAQMLGLPYFVIHNEPGAQGLENAVATLAMRAGVDR